MALLLGGALTGMQTAQAAAGEPVYWFGLSERILTWVWLLRVAVLAIALLRSQPNSPET